MDCMYNLKYLLSAMLHHRDMYIFFYSYFLAALSSSRTTVVGRSVRRSVR
jgi:hypothetical protein